MKRFIFKAVSSIVVFCFIFSNFTPPFLQTKVSGEGRAGFIPSNYGDKKVDGDTFVIKSFPQSKSVPTSRGKAVPILLSKSVPIHLRQPAPTEDQIDPEHPTITVASALTTDLQSAGAQASATTPATTSHTVVRAGSLRGDVRTYNVGGPSKRGKTYGRDERGLFGKRAGQRAVVGHPLAQATPTLSEVVQPYFASQETARELLTTGQVAKFKISPSTFREFEACIRVVISRIDDPMNNALTFRERPIDAFFRSIITTENSSAMFVVQETIEFLEKQKQFRVPKSEHPRELREKVNQRIQVLRNTLVQTAAALEACRDKVSSSLTIGDIVRDYYQAQDLAEKVLTSKELGSMRLTSEQLSSVRNMFKLVIAGLDKEIFNPELNTEDKQEVVDAFSVKILFNDYAFAVYNGMLTGGENKAVSAAIELLEKEFPESDLTRVYGDYEDNADAISRRNAKLRAVLDAITNAIPAAAPAATPTLAKEETATSLDKALAEARKNIVASERIQETLGLLNELIADLRATIDASSLTLLIQKWQARYASDANGSLSVEKLSSIIKEAQELRDLIQAREAAASLLTHNSYEYVIDRLIGDANWNPALVRFFLTEYSSATIRVMAAEGMLSLFAFTMEGSYEIPQTSKPLSKILDNLIGPGKMTLGGAVEKIISDKKLNREAVDIALHMLMPVKVKVYPPLARMIDPKTEGPVEVATRARSVDEIMRNLKNRVSDRGREQFGSGNLCYLIDGRPRWVTWDDKIRFLPGAELEFRPIEPPSGQGAVIGLPIGQGAMVGPPIAQAIAEATDTASRGSNNGYVTFRQHTLLVNPYIEEQWTIDESRKAQGEDPVQVIRQPELETILGASEDGIKIYVVEGLFDATGVADHWGITRRAVYVDKHILENLALEEQRKYTKHPLDELRATLALGRQKGIDDRELARRFDNNITISDTILLNNDALLWSFHNTATSFPDKVTGYVNNSPLNNATNLAAAAELRYLLEFVTKKEVINDYFNKPALRGVLSGMGYKPNDITRIIDALYTLYKDLVNNEIAINRGGATYKDIHTAMVARLNNFIEYYNQRMQTFIPVDETSAVRGAGGPADLISITRKSIVVNFRGKDGEVRYATAGEIWDQSEEIMAGSSEFSVDQTVLIPYPVTIRQILESDPKRGIKFILRQPWNIQLADGTVEPLNVKYGNGRIVICRNDDRVVVHLNFASDPADLLRHFRERVKGAGLEFTAESQKALADQIGHFTVFYEQKPVPAAAEDAKPAPAAVPPAPTTPPTPNVSDKLNERFGTRLKNNDLSVIDEIAIYYTNLPIEERQIVYEWLQHHESALAAKVIARIGLNWPGVVTKLVAKIRGEVDSNPRAAARQLHELVTEGTYGGLTTPDEVVVRAKKVWEEHPEFGALLEYISVPAFPKLQAAQPGKLVLARHGQTTWSEAILNKWAGWHNSPITEQGRSEAFEAGKRINVDGLHFDVAYTSDFSRARITLAEILKATGQQNIPEVSDRALRERDYGDMIGWNRKDVEQVFGRDILKQWRRGYAGNKVRPPGAENLRDVQERTLPFFIAEILQKIAQGKNVIVSAHGNSLRSIMVALREHTLGRKLTEDEILALEIPLSTPIVVTFDDQLHHRELWVDSKKGPDDVNNFLLHGELYGIEPGEPKPQVAPVEVFPGEFSDTGKLTAAPVATVTAPVAPVVLGQSLGNILADLNSQANKDTIANALDGAKKTNVELIIAYETLGDVIEEAQVISMVDALKEAGLNLTLSFGRSNTKGLPKVYLITPDEIDAFCDMICNPEDRVIAMRPLTDTNQLAVLHKAIFACLALRNLTLEDISQGAGNKKVQAALTLYNSLNPAEELEFDDLVKLVDADTNIDVFRQLLRKIVANLPVPQPQKGEDLKRAFDAIVAALSKV